MRGFYCRNITFEQETKGKGIVVKGEITNSSGRNYNAVVFRIILYIKELPIGNTKLLINGFNNGQTRRFEQRIEDLRYDVIKNKVVDWQIEPESWY